MARKSLYASVRVRPSIPFALRTGNATTNGTSVPMNYNSQQFRVALAVFHAGTLTDGTLTLTIEDSPTGSGSWVVVPPERLEGALATMPSTADDTIQEVGVVVDPSRPFLRTVAVQAAATTGGVFGAYIILGSPNYTPVDRT